MLSWDVHPAIVCNMNAEIYAKSTEIDTGQYFERVGTTGAEAGTLIQFLQTPFKRKGRATRPASLDRSLDG